VRVVLPGEADAPVHLDVELRIADVGGQRLGGGDRARQRELLGVPRRGPGGVPGGGRGQLGGDEHVGAVVLHGSIGADDPSELLAGLGVVGCHLDALVSTAGRFGGREGAGECQCPRPPVRKDGDRLKRHAFEPDSGGPPRRIEVACRRHADARGASGHDRKVVAHGQRQQVGRAGAEHDAGVAVDHPIVDRQ
jgi:hypothetical protein